MWLIKHRPTNLTIQMSTPAHVCSLHASCMFMWGGQRPVLSAFPNAPGSRTEAWWNHRKLDCLPFALEAARKRHSSPPQYLQLARPPPTSLVHPSSHPIMKACCTKPLLLHVIQSFPLRCRNAGLYVSRVLNKAAACTMAAGELQHCVVHHPNGVEQCV